MKSSYNISEYLKLVNSTVEVNHEIAKQFFKGFPKEVKKSAYSALVAQNAKDFSSPKRSFAPGLTPQEKLEIEETIFEKASEKRAMRTICSNRNNKVVELGNPYNKLAAAKAIIKNKLEKALKYIPAMGYNMGNQICLYCVNSKGNAIVSATTDTREEYPIRSKYKAKHGYATIEMTVSDAIALKIQNGKLVVDNKELVFSGEKQFYKWEWKEIK